MLGALVVARSAGARSDAKETAKTAAPAKPAPLGVSYGAWKGQYADAAKRVASFKELGFQIVSFIPTYSYVGRNKIDLALRSRMRPSSPTRWRSRCARGWASW